jgi:hypothetical protein
MRVKAKPRKPAPKLRELVIKKESNLVKITLRMPSDLLKILDQKAFDCYLSRNQLMNSIINFYLGYLNKTYIRGDR